MWHFTNLLPPIIYVRPHRFTHQLLELFKYFFDPYRSLGFNIMQQY